MKKYIALFALALALVALPMFGLAEAFDPAGFIDWFNESNTWMTVANGHWSADPADQPTDEDLAKIFSATVKQQNAVHWTPWYFIVVKDVEEQRKIIGDYWGAPEDMATEGTVTVLCLADQLLTEEQGHVSKYDGYYMPTKFATYDAGLTCGLFGVAAATMGYQTHYFGEINGEYAPKDLADGQYQSLSRYVKDEYTRVWGMMSPLEGEVNEAYTYPVAGNCVFVCALVVGKPAADETIETWGTNHARPNNWVIWDGVPNENPSPVASGAVVVEAEEVVAEEAPAIEVGENEYIGVGQGIHGDVQVKVSFADGKIAAVEVVAHNETTGICEPAIEQIPGAIVAAQSADVDAITGVTVTSEAIKAAVKDAMAQAGL